MKIDTNTKAAFLALALLLGGGVVAVNNSNAQPEIASAPTPVEVVTPVETYTPAPRPLKTDVRINGAWFPATVRQNSDGTRVRLTVEVGGGMTTWMNYKIDWSNNTVRISHEYNTHTGTVETSPGGSILYITYDDGYGTDVIRIAR